MVIKEMKCEILGRKQFVILVELETDCKELRISFIFASEYGNLKSIIKYGSYRKDQFQFPWSDKPLCR